MDACCLNRLTDDQSQPRVREEAGAMEQILRMVQQDLATWVSSSILGVEIARNPDEERRNDVNSLLVFANEVVRRRQRMLIGRRNFKILALARLTPCIWLVRNARKSTCFSPLMTDCSAALADTRAHYASGQRTRYPGTGSWRNDAT